MSQFGHVVSPGEEIPHSQVLELAERHVQRAGQADDHRADEVDTLLQIIGATLKLVEPGENVGDGSATRRTGIVTLAH